MKNWSLISEKLTLGSHNERTGKQCRERYEIYKVDGITILIPTSINDNGPVEMMRCCLMRIAGMAASGRRSLSSCPAGMIDITQD